MTDIISSELLFLGQHIFSAAATVLDDFYLTAQDTVGYQSLRQYQEQWGPSSSQSPIKKKMEETVPQQNLNEMKYQIMI